MNSERQPGLFNIFSNVWLFFGYNTKEHDHILKKVKALHGITKLISLDELCKFWIAGIEAGGYTPEIRQQMIIDRRTKLTAIYRNTTAQIDIAIKTNNLENAPTVLCIYTLNQYGGFECLVGLYLYYLNTRASMSLAHSARALSSKVSGVEYQMTEEMKQFLYLTCSNESTS